jgi:hypothetical protein
MTLGSAAAISPSLATCVQMLLAEEIASLGAVIC